MYLRKFKLMIFSSVFFLILRGGDCDPEENNSSKTLNETKDAKSSYSISRITTDETSTAISFLKEVFFRDEPLNVATQLFEETGSEAELEKYCISCLKYGMTFMAVSSTGDIMGIILNTIKNRDDKEETIDKDEANNKNLRFNNIVDLLNKINREADVFTKYPHVNRIMEIKIVAVDKKYRGQGVCKALVDKTKEFALEMGCQMVYVECTSHFSAKAVERLGFECIYSLNYSDYVNEKGETIFKPISPHTSAKVYVLPLNNVNV